MFYAQLALIAAVLVSCGKPPETAPTFIKALLGRWEICRENGGNYQHISMSFSQNSDTGGDVLVELQYFADRECKSPDRSELDTSTLTYLIGEDSTTVPGAKNIDFIEKKSGIVSYTIMKLEGDKLYGGLGTGNTSPSTRQNSLGSIYFTRPR